MKSVLIKDVILKGVKKDILIEGNMISRISDKIEHSADKVILAKGKVVIPGFINMHTHAAMTLFRSCSEDLPLHSWLEEIWKQESKLTEEMIYWGTKLACLEMIKSGTTTFNDQYWMVPSAYKAVQEMGLRAHLSYVILDNYDQKKASIQKEECEKIYEMSKSWIDRCRFAVSIHSPYTVSEEMILWGSEFAKKRGLPLHIHLSETEQENISINTKYGLSPTMYLERLGVLNRDTIAAHSLWLSEQDIEVLGKRGVNTVHNVNSNLMLASGYKFKYNELRDAGSTVCLGTDGCASSNNLDILEAMKTASLLQKAWRRDPTALPVVQVMDMATVNGAKALKINSGKIEQGALADLLLIDVDSVSFTPNFNFEANLVYSANSSCVDTMICDGEVLMEGRRVADEDQILREATIVSERLFGRVN